MSVIVRFKEGGSTSQDFGPFDSAKVSEGKVYGIAGSTPVLLAAQEMLYKSDPPVVDGGLPYCRMGLSWSVGGSMYSDLEVVGV